MEPFTVTIDEVNYQVSLHSAFPKLFDVFNQHINYIIGKTDAGNWVYIKHEPVSAFIPIEQIGEAIDEHIAEY
ncbi:hypothetical protein SNE25_13485 [Mucilaginibacter sabulilitoris]|uniref:Uncharacterized protein n=1 Tax=Mucilaginibacter sabulilitoris TaxID=1173583 RepID=A0ABZ0TUV1_9SPHI|nr:hypothetical protein [Mucilaginibacter sabulilitoris]WPU96531.1 hypothetical protein SNE25_13485 [Mucilaginibacter sabulilitoris]